MRKTNEIKKTTDALRDVIYGRTAMFEDANGRMVFPPLPAMRGVLTRLKKLEATVREQAGLIEQLAALHGKEITDFKPTTSKHSRILVDADKEPDDV